MADSRGRSGLPKKRAAFLAALAESGNVTKACELSGLCRASAYNERKANPDFAAAWEEAVELGADALEDEAQRRAVDGVDRPVFYQGEKCGAVREYSDTLLIFLLKGAKPEKYRERHGWTDETLSDAERVRRVAAILDQARARRAGSAADAADDGESE